MCGISGIYSYSGPGISEEKMILFTDSLAHRGPDGRGLYRDAQEPLWLGHRRLTILDLSAAANQPLSYVNGRYWIVFNGEIYNFLEIRRELEAKGYDFQTEGDTEVLLASYVEWGKDCQYKFNGMWAFAIWDVLERTLFLSRDRFGVKPLYFSHSKSQFAFASELKAFSVLFEGSIPFHAAYIASALQNSSGIEAQEETFIEGVLQLLPGRCLSFHAKSGIQIEKWWETLDHLYETSQNFEDQVSEFQALFSDACRIRARSDVPIGTALSGGIDSSSVFCKLWELNQSDEVDRTRWTPKWQQVFSVFFPRTSQNEESFVQEVLNRYPVASTIYQVQADDVIPMIDEICYQFEGVFDLSIGPWLLYREYRRNKTAISLDGHGADELFGGYHHQVEGAMIESLKKGQFSRSRELRKIYQSLYPVGSPQKPASLPWILGRHLMQNYGTRNGFDSIRKAAHYLRGNSQSARAVSDWLRIRPSLLEEKPARHPQFSKLSFLNQILYLDFHERTLPIILRNFDRCSMAHGVEIRAPFLDWRLVCFAFSLPSNSKIGNGFTKRIVRDAMKGSLPEPIRTRKDKIGFASPLIEWMKGGLKPYILDTVGSSSFLSSSIWDGPRIQRHVEECFAKGDLLNARRCWEFVLAERLMHLFQKKTATSRNLL